jgi:hypothetical protein
VLSPIPVQSIDHCYRTGEYGNPMTAEFQTNQLEGRENFK